MTANFESSAFGAEWNTLERSQRLRLRRLVRIGGKVEDPTLARLAPAYAQMQLQRVWMRLFWLWFIPGTLIALSVAATIHPVFVGIVIAMAAQAAWAHFSLRKVARRSA